MRRTTIAGIVLVTVLVLVAVSSVIAHLFGSAKADQLITAGGGGLTPPLNIHYSIPSGDTTPLMLLKNDNGAGSNASSILKVSGANFDVLTADATGGVTIPGEAFAGSFSGVGSNQPPNGGGVVIRSAHSSSSIAATSVGARFGFEFSPTLPAGAKIAAFYSNNLSIEKLGIDRDGKFIVPTGGAADTAGRAVLVAGTVTVTTTAVTATSVVQLTRCVTGGTVGEPSVGTVVAGTSFVVNSLQPGTAGTVQSADTSTVCWRLLN